MAGGGQGGRWRAGDRTGPVGLRTGPESSVTNLPGGGGGQSPEPVPKGGEGVERSGAGRAPDGGVGGSSGRNMKKPLPEKSRRREKNRPGG